MRVWELGTLGDLLETYFLTIFGVLFLYLWIDDRIKSLKWSRLFSVLYIGIILTLISLFCVYFRSSTAEHLLLMAGLFSLVFIGLGFLSLLLFVFALKDAVDDRKFERKAMLWFFFLGLVLVFLIIVSALIIYRGGFLLF